ncbi:MAG: hypothetical protein HGA95_03060 [Caldiserica bacterium]|nr:hypothetical protein [Caldisericota bacterium]
MKKILVLAMCFCVSLSLIACGNQDSTTLPTQDNGNGTNQQQEQTGGTMFDHKFVSGETFDGWNFVPDAKNEIFASISNPMATKFIMMKFEWQNTTDPQKQTEKFIKDYPDLKPTPAEKVTYGENEYWKTVYVNMGYTNIQLITQKGEILETVTIQGTEETDPTVVKILNTLKFKDVKLEDLGK